MKKQEDRSTLWLMTMGELLKGGAVAAVVTLLTALFCAVAISLGVLGEERLTGVVLGCCVLGSGTGGLLSCRRLKKRPVPVGLAVGGTLFLILLTAGGLTQEAVSVENEGLPILTACLCGGAGAGILASQPKKKRKR